MQIKLVLIYALNTESSYLRGRALYIPCPIMWDDLRQFWSQSSILLYPSPHVAFGNNAVMTKRCCICCVCWMPNTNDVEAFSLLKTEKREEEEKKLTFHSYKKQFWNSFQFASSLNLPFFILTCQCLSFRNASIDAGAFDCSLTFPVFSLLHLNKMIEHH